jgi:hypothetical protein
LATTSYAAVCLSLCCRTLAIGRDRSNDLAQRSSTPARQHASTPARQRAITPSRRHKGSNAISSKALRNISVAKVSSDFKPSAWW